MKRYAYDRTSCQLLEMDESDFANGVLCHQNGKKASAGTVVRRDDTSATPEEAILRAARLFHSHIENNAELARQHLANVSRWNEHLKRITKHPNTLPITTLQ